MMIAALVIAASSMAIPFESAPPPRTERAAKGPVQRYEMGFEFSETDSGYQLNAVLFDLSSGVRAKTAISPCERIDIDSFTETDFGTPVLCNGVTYTFNIRNGAIIAGPMNGGRAVELKRLAPGRAYVNGMPLLIRASR